MRLPEIQSQRTPFLLRIVQTSQGQHKHRIDLFFDGPGLTFSSATAYGIFTLTAQMEEDLRWYLEDYLLQPLEPGPIIAREIEERIAAIGERLFHNLFEINEVTKRLWADIAPRLSQTRIEVVTSMSDEWSVPWELLREPETSRLLCLSAGNFVRRAAQQATAPARQHSIEGPLRVLYVLSRPDGENDVSLRYVAGPIFERIMLLTDIRVDVLRPPSFEQLKLRLKSMQMQGQPYHVVHFDGHGEYCDLVYNPPREPRGYVVFENPRQRNPRQLVRGNQLGRILSEAGVEMLILNACRSAHASKAPREGVVDARTLVFGSLAQEVIASGVPNVLAMRYNLYPETAALFMSELYTALLAGQGLGEAATHCRRQLERMPLRTIEGVDYRLQDWIVPAIYEIMPIFFQVRGGTRAGVTHLRLTRASSLPPLVGADASYDNIIYQLDRGFDSTYAVLLYGLAGCGKSAGAQEFARWYMLTGGIDGPTLRSSLKEQHSFGQLLDHAAANFHAAISNSGDTWAQLDLSTRQTRLLQIFRHLPVLWIWDDVDWVEGWPTAGIKGWEPSDREALVTFMSELQQVGTRLLLIARRPQLSWIGIKLRQVLVPPLDVDHAAMHLKAVVEQAGLPYQAAEWEPVISFSRGNPLTLSMTAANLLGLLQGPDRAKQISTYVQNIAAGGHFNVGPLLGLTSDVNLAQFFDQDLQPLAALVGLFRGHIDTVNLLLMIHRGESEALAELNGLTRHDCACLLERLEQLGLLYEQNETLYMLHPLLPAACHDLLQTHYPNRVTGANPSTSAWQRALRAYAGAFGRVGTQLFEDYDHNPSGVVDRINLDLSNLAKARAIAKAFGMQDALYGIGKALICLYMHQGEEGQQMISYEQVDDVIETLAALYGPTPSPDNHTAWLFMCTYKLRVIQQQQGLSAALQQCADWLNNFRGQVDGTLHLERAQLDSAQISIVTIFMNLLVKYAGLLVADGRPECCHYLEEALGIAQRYMNPTDESALLAKLANAYYRVPKIRDLRRAQALYEQSLSITSDSDIMERIDHLTMLGLVIYLQVVENPWSKLKQGIGLASEGFVGHAAALWSDTTESEQTLYVAHTARSIRSLLQRMGLGKIKGGLDPVVQALLQQSLERYQEALRICPNNADHHLGVIYNQLGNVYTSIGDNEQAQMCYHKAIRYADLCGNITDGADRRRNMARTLIAELRFDEAYHYLQSALRCLEQISDDGERRKLTLALLRRVKITRTLKKGVQNLSAYIHVPDTKTGE